MTVVHENFTGDVKDGNDIAMLKLLSASSHPPASLPPSTHITDGLEDVATVGWGLQEDGTTPLDLRQKSHVRILPNRFCDSEDSWGSLITDTMLCAFGFGAEQDTCQGAWACLNSLVAHTKCTAKRMGPFHWVVWRMTAWLCVFFMFQISVHVRNVHVYVAGVFVGSQTNAFSPESLKLFY